MIRVFLTSMAMTAALLASGCEFDEGMDVSTYPSAPSGTTSGQMTRDVGGRSGEYDASTDQRWSSTADTGVRSGAGSMGAQPISGSERDFLVEAGSGHLAEIQTAQIAQQRAGSTDVQNLAQQMIQEHTRLSNNLQQVAQQANVSVPNQLSSQHQQDYDRLVKYSGQEFDRQYLQHLINDHQRDIDRYQRMASQASDPNVRAYAQQTLPSLRQHLQQVRDVQQKVLNNGSGQQNPQNQSIQPNGSQQNPPSPSSNGNAPIDSGSNGASQ